MQETQVQFLVWEDTVKGKTTHSNILAWTVHGVTQSDTIKWLSFHFNYQKISLKNGKMSFSFIILL